MVYNAFNFSDIFIYASGVPVSVVNPYDYAVIFLLSIIAFTEVWSFMNMLRSWIVDKREI